MQDTIVICLRYMMIATAAATPGQLLITLTARFQAIFHHEPQIKILTKFPTKSTFIGPGQIT